ncbi:unnamed protein product [Didymodactylos carnosus]|uniref:NAD(P)(+)--arginine ADP-ribosyltransferase n=1 Tax=Didymodactylos carnosus TaxID=1234261 RepID=A0A814QAP3_9BILA|nr:unnamed protein product [Didymodactylos carnosus]CAF1117294.1 unnamed protein product [Didymodactylos carnosus]CAF3769600.1 unnamed protein product [Didymodactylos carnosus]CAF3881116.1 unnamed protein product [Didymodactylos carnosus]
MTSENRRNLRPEETEENLEDVTLIWLDENINDSLESRYKQSLFSELNNYIQYYTDPRLCIDYIQIVVSEKILLIVSPFLSRNILPVVHGQQSINSIFIFGNNRCQYESLISQYSKVIDIFTDQQLLLKSIRDTLHLVSKQSLAFNLFDQQKQKSTRDLSKDSASFLWYQLLLDILKKMPQTEQSKNDMLEKCSDYYRSNKFQLRKIDHFRTSYTADRAIEWYTDECFLYKLLNKALRTEDIDLLYLFRFYVIDLCKQLEYENGLLQKTDMLTLYRGQLLSIQEFEKLKQSIGVLISTNGFFSATKDINIALVFISGTSDTDELKPVLFEIQVDSNLKTVVFADIDKYSGMQGEKEVLFSLGAVFKIDNIYFDYNYNYWKIQMTATEDGSKYTQEYLDFSRKEIKHS